MKTSPLFKAIIIVAFIVVLIGCTGQPTTPESTTPPPVGETPTPPTSEYVTGEPLCTSDLTGSGTVTASTEGIADPPSSVFDDDDSTCWQVFDSDKEWLLYDFHEGVIMGEYSITTIMNPSAMPSSFTLQGSNDRVKWTTLDTRTSVLPAWSVSYAFINQNAYRYYRLAKICRQPDMAQFIIEEMQLCPSSMPSEDWVWSEAVGKYIRMEDGTWIWCGFHHEWNQNAHRFNDLQSEYFDIGYNCDPKNGISLLTGSVRGEQTIPASDYLNYYTIKRGIKTGVAEFRYGSIEATISGAVDEYVEKVFPQEISLDGLEKYDNVTIFMRGFSFEEDASQLESEKGAYPVRGFGLNVSDIQRLGSVIKFNYTVMLHPAPQPMWPNPTPDPWRYRITYYYTLVGGNDGEFSFTYADKNYHGEHVASGTHDCPSPPDKVRETTIEGHKGYNDGVVAFRGFSIRINRDTTGLSGSGLKNKGRLVRTVDVAIPWQGYSSQTGSAFFAPNIYFCNKDIGQNAMNTEYEGFFTLLQFQDPDQWRDQWDMTPEFKDAGNGQIEGMSGKIDNYGYSNNLESVSFSTP